MIALKYILNISSFLLLLMSPAFAADVEKELFPNGNLKLECPLSNGIRNGMCKEYYEDGSLYKTIPYKNGVIDGMSKIYFEKKAGAIYDKGTGSFCFSIVYKNGEVISGNKRNGKRLTDEELKSYKSYGQTISCE